MYLQPVGDRVFVKKDNPETVTKGGIALPEQSIERVTVGTIVAIGPGTYAKKTGRFMPTVLKPGTKVLFHPYAGSQMQVGDDIYYNMPEADVWAVIADNNQQSTR
jgi:chaperonin GroES